jgi:hypothetical protein
VKNTNPEGENVNPKFPDLGSYDRMAREGRMEARNGWMVMDNDQWDAKESSDGCGRANE